MPQDFAQDASENIFATTENFYKIVIEKLGSSKMLSAMPERAENIELTEMYSFLIESRRKVLQVELDFEGIRKRREGV